MDRACNIVPNEAGAKLRMKNKSIIPPLQTVSLKDYRAKEKKTQHTLSTTGINQKRWAT